MGISLPDDRLRLAAEGGRSTRGAGRLGLKPGAGARLPMGPLTD